MFLPTSQKTQCSCCFRMSQLDGTSVCNLSAWEAEGIAESVRLSWATVTSRPAYARVKGPGVLSLTKP